MRKIKFLFKASSYYFIIVCIMLTIANICFIFGINGLVNFQQYIHQFNKSTQNDYLLQIKQPNDILLDYEQDFVLQFLENEKFNHKELLTGVEVTSYHIEAIQDEKQNSYQKEENFQLSFYSDPDMIDDFIAKNRVIIEGSKLNESLDIDNGCLVSKELARANNLHVGSVLTFFHQSNWNLNFYFRVVGIYQDYTESQYYSINRRNEIISDQRVFEMISKRYNGSIEIPYQQTYLFSAKQDDVEQLKQNMPSSFEIISTSDYYKNHLIIFREYIQILVLLLTLSIVAILGAIRLINRFCIIHWRQLNYLTHCSLFNMKTYIKQFKCIFYFMIIAVPFIINRFCYEIVNKNIMYNIVNQRNLFSQNTIGVMLSNNMIPYYETPFELYCINFDLLTNIIIFIIMILCIKIVIKYLKKRG